MIADYLKQRLMKQQVWLSILPVEVNGWLFMKENTVENYFIGLASPPPVSSSCS